MEANGEIHTPVGLTTRKNDGTQQIIGDWVGPRDGQEILDKRKTLAPAEIRTPETSARTLKIANMLLRLFGKYVSQNKDSAY